MDVNVDIMKNYNKMKYLRDQSDNIRLINNVKASFARKRYNNLAKMRSQNLAAVVPENLAVHVPEYLAVHVPEYLEKTDMKQNSYEKGIIINKGIIIKK